MPATTTEAKEHRARWAEIVRDPSLRDLPYKVETNNRGQVVLSPRKNRRSKLQRVLQKYLDEYAPEGECILNMHSLPPKAKGAGRGLDQS